MAVTRKIPQRQCLGCGEMKDKKSMLRVIKTQEGEILLDATGRKNGRGAYICADMNCLNKAIKSKTKPKTSQPDTFKYRVSTKLNNKDIP